MSDDIRDLTQIPGAILQQMSHTIFGKEEVKETLLVAFLCEGHVLIEGPPGTAKTFTAKTFARLIGLEFKRLQCTPDMLPADITGFNLYTPAGDGRFIPGPIFANVLLADELNRTTPRTQSALLEGMQESQVTIEGMTHPLPRPFLVIASQLPYGGEGTYPLTEVQADRFMFRVWSGNPSQAEEQEVIEAIDRLEREEVQPLVSPAMASQLQERVQQVFVATKVSEYITSLVVGIRQDPDVFTGPSPRASIALFKGARALAFLGGREFVVPDDVKRLAQRALDHRIRIKPEAEIDELTPRTVLERVLAQVPVPTL